jgi:hypothetical protein
MLRPCAQEPALNCAHGLQVAGRRLQAATKLLEKIAVDFVILSEAWNLFSV